MNQVMNSVRTAGDVAVFVIYSSSQSEALPSDVTAGRQKHAWNKFEFMLREIVFFLWLNNEDGKSDVLDHKFNRRLCLNVLWGLFESNLPILAEI